MVPYFSSRVAIACVLVVFPALFVSQFGLYFTDDPGQSADSELDRGHPARLVVGVLSARHRRRQRDAIRDTWWPQLKAAGARGVFVLGDSECHLADQCRVDRYSCQPRASPRRAGDRQSLGLEPGPADQPAADGLTFTALRSVVARAVTSHNVSSDVILQTADGQTAAVTSPGGGSSDVTAPLSPLLVLPAGFMGVLRLRQPGGVARCRQTEVPPPAELSITALVTADGRHVRPGLEPLCLPLALVYTVHEEESDAAGAPSEVTDGRSADPGTLPAACRRSDADLVSRAVTEEAGRHGDLLLVPGPDVYRRLPDKLLSFFGWVSSETSADWVVKCDDDVVLDVPRILQNVPPAPADGLWWGQFRYNWPVDRYGKWAELVYQADVYPPFACGTASLLSADVVRWLAVNGQQLTRFQGEDVSLGIWLSGHRVRRVSDPAWSCGDTDSGGYSLGQLTPDQLRRTWRCLGNTGRLELCGGGPEAED